MMICSLMEGVNVDVELSGGSGLFQKVDRLGSDFEGLERNQGKKKDELPATYSAVC